MAVDSDDQERLGMRVCLLAGCSLTDRNRTCDNAQGREEDAAKATRKHLGNQ